MSSNDTSTQLCFKVKQELALYCPLHAEWCYWILADGYMVTNVTKSYTVRSLDTLHRFYGYVCIVLYCIVLWSPNISRVWEPCKMHGEATHAMSACQTLSWGIGEVKTGNSGPASAETSGCGRNGFHVNLCGNHEINFLDHFDTVP